MAEITPAGILEAAEILRIGEKASMTEIRQRYHEEIKKIHPDISGNDPAVSHEMTLRLNQAYSILAGYCMNYTFSFNIKDISRSISDSGNNYAEFWKERFGDDPIWG